MKILFASWECAPFFKLGGLGDVARSLPKALFSLGIDVRVVLPFYKVLKIFNQQKILVSELTIEYDRKPIKINVYQINFIDAPIPVYLLENHEFFDKPNGDTFFVFSLAVSTLIEKQILKWVPDIIHCNDHHTGFIPFFIKHKKLAVKSIFTIHNIFFQGTAPVQILDKLHIEHTACRLIQWEIEAKKINSLLEGVIHADIVTTVSPTYAKEILTEEYGYGLDDVLRGEEAKITGIQNGIDYDTKNPSTDKNITYHYSTDTFQAEKAKNKAYLQKTIGFAQEPNIPLIGFIGRFDARQKGLDIMHKMLRRIDLSGYQFIFLGSGNQEWEERFLWLSSFYPNNIYCKFSFDELFASEMYAASDFLLVPSKFEPCGLIQMIAMHYGTLPIARATGGLKDSITDGIDGYLFQNYSSEELEKRLLDAINIFQNDKTKHETMIRAAMQKDFSWTKSAKEYMKLYNKLLEK
jgi:starch synthase